MPERGLQPLPVRLLVPRIPGFSIDFVTGTGSKHKHNVYVSSLFPFSACVCQLDHHHIFLVGNYHAH